MKWVVHRRNYHGEEAAAMVRWVVVREGDLRGCFECWEEGSAKMIAAALNDSEVC